MKGIAYNCIGSMVDNDLVSCFCKGGRHQMIEYRHFVSGRNLVCNRGDTCRAQCCGSLFHRCPYNRCQVKGVGMQLCGELVGCEIVNDVLKLCGVTLR